MKFDWNLVSSSQKLVEQCVAKGFVTYINWQTLTYRCKLSEDFIREYKDYLPWSMVCRHQKLSENFIRQMQPLIDKQILSVWRGDFLSDKIKKQLKIFPL